MATSILQYLVGEAQTPKQLFFNSAGALREAGKLILIVSLVDLCAMHHARDNADNPKVVLYAVLDALPAGLCR